MKRFDFQDALLLLGIGSIVIGVSCISRPVAAIVFGVFCLWGVRLLARTSATRIDKPEGKN